MTTFEALRAAFATLVPELTRMAAAAFRHLDPEAREENVQNTLALCWHAYRSLIEQGRGDEPGLVKSVLWYSIKQTKAGRSVPTGEFTKPKCFFNHAKNCRVLLQRIDLRLFVADETPVPDQVSFCLDVPHFLATLNDRQRRMADDLMSGMSTNECAAKFGVSAAAVSQFRTRFRELFDAFMAT
ncbi:MAG TPA: hypothetical protein VFE62_00855 [Gemmataceae bacterium]|nr:hypothetical protein [Gemmataceae bacterium]